MFLPRLKFDIVSLPRMTSDKNIPTTCAMSAVERMLADALEKGT